VCARTDAIVNRWPAPPGAAILPTARAGIRVGGPGACDRKQTAAVRSKNTACQGKRSRPGARHEGRFFRMANVGSLIGASLTGMENSGGRLFCPNPLHSPGNWPGPPRPTASILLVRIVERWARRIPFHRRPYRPFGAGFKTSPVREPPNEYRPVASLGRTAAP
jgi:hypothetical protein